MRKRYIAAMLGVVMCLCVTGCTVNSTSVGNVDIDKATEVAETTVEEVADESGEAEVSTENEGEESGEAEAPVDESEESADISGEGDVSKYEGFLNGTEKAVIDFSGDTASYYSFKRALDANTPYTLDEIIENLKKFMEQDFWQIKPEAGGVEYAYIDCGKDGVKELLLLLHLPVENENFDVRMVVKDINGTLTVVYDNDSWSRSETVVTEYGYVIGGGSGGASSEVVEYGVIDKDGKWTYIYGVDYEDGELGYVWFETDYDKRVTYYAYDPGFSSERSKVLSKAEVEEMIDKRVKEVNVSEEIANGKEPAYTKLVKSDDAKDDSIGENAVK